MNLKINSLLISVLVIPLFISVSAYAEEQKSLPENLSLTYSNGTISISAKDILLIDLFSAISEKTGTEFIYSKTALADKKITIELPETHLQDGIKEVFKACDIKNYTMKRGEDPLKPVSQVEILATPSSSGPPSGEPTEEATSRYPDIEARQPDIEQEEEPVLEEEAIEEPTEDKSDEYMPPESETTSEEKEITEEETGKAQEVGSRTFTGSSVTSSYGTQQTQEQKTGATKLIPSQQIRDVSNQYFPPGSQNTRKQTITTINPNEPIKDMSNEYHPPGYTPSGSDTQDRSNEYSPPGYQPSNEPIRDMSDQYRPPG